MVLSKIIFYQLQDGGKGIPGPSNVALFGVWYVLLFRICTIESIKVRHGNVQVAFNNPKCLRYICSSISMWKWRRAPSDDHPQYTFKYIYTKITYVYFYIYICIYVHMYIYIYVVCIASEELPNQLEQDLTYFVVYSHTTNPTVAWAVPRPTC